MSTHKLSLREAESCITEEHFKIRSLLDGLHRISDPYALLPLLRELKTTLESHFDLEEGDSGLQAIAEQHAPNHIPRVEQLFEEHTELLAAVNALIKECNACINGPLAQLRKNVATLFNRVTSHDAAETEILTDALLQEFEKPAKRR